MDEIVEITKIKTPPLGIYPEASGVCVCGRLALQASDEVLHFLWQHDPDGGRDGLVEVAGHGEETRDGDKADDDRDGGGDACADGAGAGARARAGGRLIRLFRRMIGGLVLWLTWLIGGLV